MSRFLAAHEGCGAGFQITRTGEPGRPKLRLLCQGCGQRAAYAAGDANLLGELEADPGNATEEPSSRGRRRRAKRVSRRFAAAEVGVADQVSEAAALHPPGGQQLPVPASGGARMERWLPAPAALPWWVPNLYILLVIAAGAALIAFGVSRQQDDDGGGPAFRSGPPEQSAPSVPQPASPPAAPAPAPPAQSAPPPRTQPAAATKRAKGQLDRTTVLGRFSIGVPEGWSRGTSGGAVVIESGDDEAEIRIFLQPGAEPLNSLERSARTFLKSEHARARVGQAQAVRLGPSKGRELRAVFKGGVETAIVVAADGYTYLLLGQVDAKAPANRETLTTTALRSFRVA